MSCAEGLRLKSGGFLSYPYWEGKIGQVFGVSVCGNMKSGGFCTYTCRGVLHTPRNNPRRRFGSKTRRGSRHIVCGNMKPAKFWVYPCRAQKHTPRNVLHRRFRPKTGRVLGASLLGKVKSGAFLVYPDGEMWNRAGFARTRVGAYCIRPEMPLDDGLGLKSGGFWAGTCFGRRGGSGVLTPINGDRQNASQIRPIFAASN